MKYRQLVNRVAHYSGFSDQESETALRLFTETLAARLANGERRDFASQLPIELQGLALEVPEAVQISEDDIYETFSQLQDIDRGHAKKQVLAAWQALKDALTPGEITHIKAQLPNNLTAALH